MVLLMPRKPTQGVADHGHGDVLLNHCYSLNFFMTSITRTVMKSLIYMIFRMLHEPTGAKFVAQKA